MFVWAELCAFLWEVWLSELFLFSFGASSVTWRKDNVAIRSDAFHAVGSEGGIHSLLLKQMRPSSVGSYCVTAVNPAGKASCSATVNIQQGETEPWVDTKTEPGTDEAHTRALTFINPALLRFTFSFTRARAHRPTGA